MLSIPALIIIILLLFRLVYDELWTMLQIIKSVFLRAPDLKSKYGDWAVVTGCTNGIGEAYTFELAKRGINIVLISRNPAKLSEVANELIKKHQVQTKIIVADFRHGEKIIHLIKKELADIEVGILVNNVGINSYYPMYYGEISEKKIWDLLNVNLGAMTQMTRVILPGMIQRKKGAIVNMSSLLKLMPLPLANLYSASKVFIDYFSDALRNEYKNYNLTVQVLCPSFISTQSIEYNEVLRKPSIFVPDSETYASHAIKTLGRVDNTTGYWLHRIQYAVALMMPIQIRIGLSQLMARKMRRDYFNANPKKLVTEK